MQLAGDSGREMTPLLPKIIHHTHLDEDALQPAQAITKHGISYSKTDFSICTV